MGIGSSSYPSAIDTVKDLVEAANRAESTLSAGINSSVTTLDVASTSLSSNVYGYFPFDSETLRRTRKYDYQYWRYWRTQGNR